MLAILGHCFHIVRVCRILGLVGGYGLGFFFSWVSILSFCLLIFSDCEADFKRLEARPLTDRGEGANGTANGVANGSASTSRGSASTSHGPAVSSKSAVSTGLDAKAITTHSRQNHDLKLAPGKTVSGTITSKPYQLQWQSYPTDLGHRLEWVLDLVTTFRGLNWNFRSSTFPKLEPVDKVNSRRSLQQIQRQALLNLVYSYLAIDVMKALHAEDEFFSGVISFYDPPSSAIYGADVTVSRLARLSITILSVYAALSFLFQLSPIFFSIILPSLIPYPSLLSLTRTPLLTPSVYEPFFGPLLPSVVSKGIAGFWGSFWHSLLRFGILHPSAYLIKRYRLDPASTTSRTIQVLTAFCLSGVIHGLGSYTSFPPVPDSNHPLSKTFFFFLMQGIGIIVQGYATRAIGSRSFPPMVRQTGNLLFTVIFLLLTAPILAEDTARCGAWLFEPLPVSLVRGVRGQGWWRWNGRWCGWWKDPDGRWWESGYGVY
ncbi:hypothetical protein DV738_g5075, partial [Chaetothyriales sp. CBS 135597]